MHEFSTAQGIVETAIHYAKKNKAKKVKKMFLEIGELTFLNVEQLKFSYDILSKDTILDNSELVVEVKSATYKCMKCGASGKLGRIENEDHFSIPVFHCPKCGGEIEILSGRQCFIKNMEIEV